MTASPAWLPAMAQVSEHDNQLIDKLCRYFADCIVGKLRFMDKPIRHRMEPKIDGRPEGFWHCISEGGSLGARILDVERGRRLYWIRPILENIEDPNVDWWKEGDEYVIWFSEEYKIILSPRGTDDDGSAKYFLLKTSYCTLRNHEKQKTRKRRDAASVKKPTPPTRDGA